MSKQLPSGVRKRVSEPVYPNDILGDTQLQMCTLTTRGAWFDSLLRMWADNTYELSGTNEELARIWGCTIDQTIAIISELNRRTPCDVTECRGIVTLTCRRLRRRHKQRDQNALRKQAQRHREASHAPVTPKKVPPSSSSPSSSPSSPSGEPPIAPPRGKRLTQKQKQRVKVSENTDLMVRIGAWFKRRPDTKWSILEAEALAELGDVADALDILEVYYTYDLLPDQDYRRRDLLTLLNHWTGECDRARKFTPPDRTDDASEYGRLDILGGKS